MDQHGRCQCDLQDPAEYLEALKQKYMERTAKLQNQQMELESKIMQMQTFLGRSDTSKEGTGCTCSFKQVPRVFSNYEERPEKDIVIGSRIDEKPVQCSFFQKMMENAKSILSIKCQCPSNVVNSTVTDTPTKESEPVTESKTEATHLMTDDTSKSITYISELTERTEPSTQPTISCSCRSRASRNKKQKGECLQVSIESSSNETESNDTSSTCAWKKNPAAGQYCDCQSCQCTSSVSKIEELPEENLSESHENAMTPASGVSPGPGPGENVTVEVQAIAMTENKSVDFRQLKLTSSKAVTCCCTNKKCPNNPEKLSCRANCSLRRNVQDGQNQCAFVGSPLLMNADFEHIPTQTSAIPIVERLKSNKTTSDSRLPCDCNSHPEPRNICATSVFSLNSKDVLEMQTITELVKKEKDMKRQIEELQKRERNYQEASRNMERLDTIPENSSCHCQKSNRGRGDFEAEIRMVSQELRLENNILKSELMDLKLELKHCLEKVEGPMKQKLETEKLKCEQLQRELQSSSKNMLISQDTYMREMNQLKIQLCCACNSISELNQMNQRLKDEMVQLDCLCTKLEDDLIKQKIDEAETIKRLTNRKFSGEQSTKQSEEFKCDSSLAVVARKLSKTIKDLAPCDECSRLPPEVTGAAKCIKELTDLVLKRRSKQPKQHGCSCQREPPSRDYLEEECCTCCAGDTGERTDKKIKAPEEKPLTTLLSIPDTFVQKGISSKFEVGLAESSYYSAKGEPAKDEAVTSLPMENRGTTTIKEEPKMERPCSNIGEPCHRGKPEKEKITSLPRDIPMTASSKSTETEKDDEEEKPKMDRPCSKIGEPCQRGRPTAEEVEVLPPKDMSMIKKSESTETEKEEEKKTKTERPCTKIGEPCRKERPQEEGIEVSSPKDIPLIKKSESTETEKQEEKKPKMERPCSKIGEPCRKGRPADARVEVSPSKDMESKGSAAVEEQDKKKRPCSSIGEPCRKGQSAKEAVADSQPEETPMTVEEKSTTTLEEEPVMDKPKEEELSPKPSKQDKACKAPCSGVLKPVKDEQVSKLLEAGEILEPVVAEKDVQAIETVSTGTQESAKSPKHSSEAVIKQLEQEQVPEGEISQQKQIQPFTSSDLPETKTGDGLSEPKEETVERVEALENFVVPKESAEPVLDQNEPMEHSQSEGQYMEEPHVQLQESGGIPEEQTGISREYIEATEGDNTGAPHIQLRESDGIREGPKGTPREDFVSIEEDAEEPHSPLDEYEEVYEEGQEGTVKEYVELSDDQVYRPQVQVAQPGDIFEDQTPEKLLEPALREIPFTDDRIGQFPYETETRAFAMDQPPSGLHLTTAITTSGNLEVITEGPGGTIQTTLTYNDEGNIIVETKMADFTDEGQPQDIQFQAGLLDASRDPEDQQVKAMLPIDSSRISGPSGPEVDTPYTPSSVTPDLTSQLNSSSSGVKGAYDQTADLTSYPVPGPGTTSGGIGQLASSGVVGDKFAGVGLFQSDEEPTAASEEPTATGLEIRSGDVFTPDQMISEDESILPPETQPFSDNIIMTQKVFSIPSGSPQEAELVPSERIDKGVTEGEVEIDMQILDSGEDTPKKPAVDEGDIVISSVGVPKSSDIVTRSLIEGDKVGEDVTMSTSIPGQPQTIDCGCQSKDQKHQSCQCCECKEIGITTSGDKETITEQDETMGKHPVTELGDTKEETDSEFVTISESTDHAAAQDLDGRKIGDTLEDFSTLSSSAKLRDWDLILDEQMLTKHPELRGKTSEQRDSIIRKLGLSISAFKPGKASSISNQDESEPAFGSLHLELLPEEAVITIDDEMLQKHPELAGKTSKDQQEILRNLGYKASIPKKLSELQSHIVVDETLLAKHPELAGKSQEEQAHILKTLGYVPSLKSHITVDDGMVTKHPELVGKTDQEQQEILKDLGYIPSIHSEVIVDDSMLKKHPELVGKTSQEQQQILKDLGYKPSIRSEVVVDDSMLRKHPELAGKTDQEQQQILKDLGYKPNIHSEVVVDDSMLRKHPELAGKTDHEQQEILKDLGYKPSILSKVIVDDSMLNKHPELVGKTSQEQQKILKDLGYKPSIHSEVLVDDSMLRKHPELAGKTDQEQQKILRDLGYKPSILSEVIVDDSMLNKHPELVGKSSQEQQKILKDLGYKPSIHSEVLVDDSMLRKHPELAGKTDQEQQKILRALDSKPSILSEVIVDDSMLNKHPELVGKSSQEQQQILKDLGYKPSIRSKVVVDDSMLRKHPELVGKTDQEQQNILKDLGYKPSILSEVVVDDSMLRKRPELVGRTDQEQQKILKDLGYTPSVHSEVFVDETMLSSHPELLGKSKEEQQNILRTLGYVPTIVVGEDLLKKHPELADKTPEEQRSKKILSESGYAVVGSTIDTAEGAVAKRSELIEKIKSNQGKMIQEGSEKPMRKRESLVKESVLEEHPELKGKSPEEQMEILLDMGYILDEIIDQIPTNIGIVQEKPSSREVSVTCKAPCKNAATAKHDTGGIDTGISIQSIPQYSDFIQQKKDTFEKRPLIKDQPSAQVALPGYAIKPSSGSLPVSFSVQVGDAEQQSPIVKSSQLMPETRSMLIQEKIISGDSAVPINQAGVEPLPPTEKPSQLTSETRSVPVHEQVISRTESVKPSSREASVSCRAVCRTVTTTDVINNDNKEDISKQSESKYKSVSKTKSDKPSSREASVSCRAACRTIATTGAINTDNREDISKQSESKYKSVSKTESDKPPSKEASVSCRAACRTVATTDDTNRDNIGDVSTQSESKCKSFSLQEKPSSRDDSASCKASCRTISVQSSHAKGGGRKKDIQEYMTARSESTTSSSSDAKEKEKQKYKIGEVPSIVSEVSDRDRPLIEPTKKSKSQRKKRSCSARYIDCVRCHCADPCRCAVCAADASERQKRPLRRPSRSCDCPPPNLVMERRMPQVKSQGSHPLGCTCEQCYCNPCSPCSPQYEPSFPSHYMSMNNYPEVAGQGELADDNSGCKLKRHASKCECIDCLCLPKIKKLAKTKEYPVVFDRKQVYQFKVNCNCVNAQNARRNMEQQRSRIPISTSSPNPPKIKSQDSKQAGGTSKTTSQPVGAQLSQSDSIYNSIACDCEICACAECPDPKKTETFQPATAIKQLQSQPNAKDCCCNGPCTCQPCPIEILTKQLREAEARLTATLQQVAATPSTVTPSQPQQHEEECDCPECVCPGADNMGKVKSIEVTRADPKITDHKPEEKIPKTVSQPSPSSPVEEECTCPECICPGAEAMKLKKSRSQPEREPDEGIPTQKSASETAPTPASTEGAGDEECTCPICACPGSTFLPKKTPEEGDFPSFQIPECDCTDCQCSPCADPKREAAKGKSAQVRQFAEGGPAEIVSCDCPECKCEPCADPKISGPSPKKQPLPIVPPTQSTKSVTIEHPDDCICPTCTCGEGDGDMQPVASEKVIAEHPEDCTCPLCQCPGDQSAKTKESKTTDMIQKVAHPPDCTCPECLCLETELPGQADVGIQPTSEKEVHALSCVCPQCLCPECTARATHVPGCRCTECICTPCDYQSGGDVITKKSAITTAQSPGKPQATDCSCIKCYCDVCSKTEKQKMIPESKSQHDSACKCLECLCKECLMKLEPLVHDDGCKCVQCLCVDCLKKLQQPDQPISSKQSAFQTGAVLAKSTKSADKNRGINCTCETCLCIDCKGLDSPTQLLQSFAPKQAGDDETCKCSECVCDPCNKKPGVFAEGVESTKQISSKGSKLQSASAKHMSADIIKQEEIEETCKCTDCICNPCKKKMGIGAIGAEASRQLSSKGSKLQSASAKQMSAQASKVACICPEETCVGRAGIKSKPASAKQSRQMDSKAARVPDCTCSVCICPGESPADINASEREMYVKQLASKTSKGDHLPNCICSVCRCSTTRVGDVGIEREIGAKESKVPTMAQVPSKARDPKSVQRVASARGDSTLDPPPFEVPTRKPCDCQKCDCIICSDKREGTGSQRPSAHPSTQIGAPGSVHPSGQIGAPASVHPSGQIGAPASVHPSGQIGDPASVHPSGQIGAPASVHPSGQIGAPASVHPSGQIGSPASVHPSGQIGAPPSVHPSGQIGAPTSVHPSGQIGAPASVHPSGQIGAPASVHPSGQIGAPASVHPSAQIGAPMSVHASAQIDFISSIHASTQMNETQIAATTIAMIATEIEISPSVHPATQMASAPSVHPVTTAQEGLVYGEGGTTATVPPSCGCEHCICRTCDGATITSQTAKTTYNPVTTAQERPTELECGCQPCTCRSCANKGHAQGGTATNENRTAKKTTSVHDGECSCPQCICRECKGVATECNVADMATSPKSSNLHSPDVQLANQPLSNKPSVRIIAPTDKLPSQQSTTLHPDPILRPSAQMTPSIHYSQQLGVQQSIQIETPASVHPSAQIGGPASVQPSSQIGVQSSIHQSTQIGVISSAHPRSQIGVPPSVHPSAQMDIPPSVHPSGQIGAPPSVHPSRQIGIPSSVHPSGQIGIPSSVHPSAQIVQLPGEHSIPQMGMPTQDGICLCPGTQTGIPPRVHPSAQIGNLPIGDPNAQLGTDPNHQPSGQIAASSSMYTSNNNNFPPIIHSSNHIGVHPSIHANTQIQEPGSDPTTQLADNTYFQSCHAPCSLIQTEAKIQTGGGPAAHIPSKPSVRIATPPEQQTTVIVGVQASATLDAETNAVPSIQIGTQASAFVEVSAQPSAQIDPNNQRSTQIASTQPSAQIGTQASVPAQVGTQLSAHPSAQQPPSMHASAQKVPTQSSVQASTQASGQVQIGTQPSAQMAEQRSIEVTVVSATAADIYLEPVNQIEGPPSLHPSAQIGGMKSAHSAQASGSAHASVQAVVIASVHPSTELAGADETDQPALTDAHYSAPINIPGSAHPRTQQAVEPGVYPNSQIPECCQPCCVPTPVGAYSSTPRNIYPSTPQVRPPSVHPSAQIGVPGSTHPSAQQVRPPSVHPSAQIGVPGSTHPSAQQVRPPSVHPSAQIGVPGSTPYPSAQQVRPPSVHPSTQIGIPTSTHPSAQQVRPPSIHPSTQIGIPGSVHPNAQQVRPASVHPSVHIGTPGSTQQVRPPSVHTSAEMCPPCDDLNPPSIQQGIQSSVHPSTQIGVPSSIHPSGQQIRPPSTHPSAQKIRPPSVHPSAQIGVPGSVHPSAQQVRPPSVHPSAQIGVPGSTHPSAQQVRPLSVHPSAQIGVPPSAQMLAGSQLAAPQPPSIHDSSVQAAIISSLHASAHPSLQLNAQLAAQASVHVSGQISSQVGAVSSAQRSSPTSAHPSNTRQPTGQPRTQFSEQPSAQQVRPPSVHPSAQIGVPGSTHPSAQQIRPASVHPSAQIGVPASTYPSAQQVRPPSVHPSAQISVPPSDQMYGGTQPAAQPPSIHGSAQVAIIGSLPASGHPSMQLNAQVAAQASIHASGQISTPVDAVSSTQRSSPPSTHPSNIRPPSGQPSTQLTEQQLSLPCDCPECNCEEDLINEVQLSTTPSAGVGPSTASRISSKAASQGKYESADTLILPKPDIKRHMHPPQCDCTECNCKPCADLKVDTLDTARTIGTVGSAGPKINTSIKDMDAIALKQNIEAIVRENQQCRQQIAEIKQALDNIKCACTEAELRTQIQDKSTPSTTAKPFVKQAAAFGQTMSGLKMALKNLQLKCKAKDRMIEAMTGELEMRGGAEVFDKILEKSQCLSEALDYDQGDDVKSSERSQVATNILFGPAKTSEMGTTSCECRDVQSKGVEVRTHKHKKKREKSNKLTCSCSKPHIIQKQDKDCQILDPTGFEVIDIRRITEDSLIVKWTKPKSDQITGYDLFVNGTLASKVMSSVRTSAMMHSLDLSKTVQITVYAVSKCGRIEPPAIAIYEINSQNQ